MDASSPPPAKPPRIDVIDWLRGLAVLLMFQAHAYDAWLAPAAKQGGGYEVIRFLSGVPSRLFLFLVGVSTAIKIESHLAKGTPRARVRREIAIRGLQIVALAYLFRLQEHALAGFHGGWEALFRVDILNNIGASLLVLAAVGVPTGTRPRYVVLLAVTALFVGLGPIIGPAQFPSFLPRPLTSYFGGQRPMAWFTLFPFGAWATVGLAVGHVWLRYGRDTRGRAWVFLAGGVIGAGLSVGTMFVRRVAPTVIHYPSDFHMQMGVGSFLYRLGWLGGIGAFAWAWTCVFRRGFSPIKQLGQTSLLMYWIHVDLCYGGIARPLRGRLDIPRASLALVGLTVLMLAISIVRTRYGAAIAGALRRLVARLRRGAPVAEPGPRP